MKIMTKIYLFYTISCQVKICSCLYCCIVSLDFHSYITCNQDVLKKNLWSVELFCEIIIIIFFFAHIYFCSKNYK